jgi:hypothetical protein
MLRIRSLLSRQALLAAGLAILTVSCMSVPASRVTTVHQRKDVPLGLCGYMGRVAADTGVDASQAELELRQQAGRRGANRVLLIADRGAIQGKAYLCHTRKLEPPEAGGPAYFGTDNGTSGPYGPNVPVIEYAPKEGQNPQQKPN